MQVSELMSSRVVAVRQSETADLAARLLSRNNIGAVPVVDDSGALVGMLTDRDLVVRCMAAGLRPQEVPVAQIMTADPVSVQAGEEAATAAARMGRAQVRRLPVLRDGALAGIVSLADLIRERREGTEEALVQISRNVSRR